MFRRDRVPDEDSVSTTTIPETGVDTGLVKPESAGGLAEAFSPDDIRFRLLGFFPFFAGLLSFHVTSVSS